MDIVENIKDYRPGSDSNRIQDKTRVVATATIRACMFHRPNSFAIILRTRKPMEPLSMMRTRLVAERLGNSKDHFDSI